MRVSRPIRMLSASEGRRTGALINTLLQRGVDWPPDGENRFNGFDHMWKTVETVLHSVRPFFTPLKQGVNEISPHRNRIGFVSAPSARGQARAFTLMEVLIAVVAFAIVLAAINGVFYGALRLRNKTVASFDEALPLQQTLAIIKRDLANIVLPGGTLSGSLQSTPTTGLNMTGNNTASPAVIVPGQACPSFFTATGISDETSPFAEVQKVAYLLIDSTNGTAGKDLFRSVTRNLLPSLQEQPVQKPLLSGVQAVSFFFYDGSQWRNTWDSTIADTKTGLTNTLPQAIKVQLALASERTGRFAPAPIELVVPLVIQARTNETTQAN